MLDLTFPVASLSKIIGLVANSLSKKDYEISHISVDSLASCDCGAIGRIMGHNIDLEITITPKGKISTLWEVTVEDSGRIHLINILWMPYDSVASSICTMFEAINYMEINLTDSKQSEEYVIEKKFIETIDEIDDCSAVIYFE